MQYPVPHRVLPTSKTGVAFSNRLVPGKATEGPEAPIMYEVILTYRPDFRERVIERLSNEEEAQQAAERLSGRYHDQLVRVWIRFIREVKSPSS
jgi:hypothetical protein